MSNNNTGITKDGKLSTSSVISQLQGSTEIIGGPSETHKGDVCFPHSSEKIIIEVKKNTGNQVRPLLYNVLVVHDVESNSYYVIPPNDVMREASSRNRGQHSEIALESFNLGMSKGRKAKYKVNGSLDEAVIKAYEQGNIDPLKNKCAKIHDVIVQLKNLLNGLIVGSSEIHNMKDCLKKSLDDLVDSW